MVFPSNALKLFQIYGRFLIVSALFSQSGNLSVSFQRICLIFYKAFIIWMLTFYSYLTI